MAAASAQRLGSGALGLVGALAMAGLVHAQQASNVCQVDAMIVFDASGSMQMMVDGESRIDMARRAVAEVLPDITADRKAGLITYSGIIGGQPGGPRVPGPGGHQCGSGIHLRVPPQLNAGPAIVDALAQTKAGGGTPLTAAVEHAADTLQYRERPGIVVLVTDGLENCGGDPCALGRKLRSASAGLVVHVIGAFLGPQQALQVSCLSEQTGGLYIPANSFDEMRAALRSVFRCKDIS
jgi:Ca-activated chloride channel homolog